MRCKKRWVRVVINRLVKFPVKPFLDDLHVKAFQEIRIEIRKQEQWTTPAETREKHHSAEVSPLIFLTLRIQSVSTGYIPVNTIGFYVFETLYGFLALPVAVSD